MKKLASIVLALALILSLVPASFAEEAARIAVICDGSGKLRQGSSSGYQR